MQNNKELAIKQLVLDFESMEELTIPAEHLYGIELYGVTESWCTYQEKGNTLSKSKSCNACLIYILHGMDTEETWYKDYMEDLEDEDTNLLERLKHDDLTSVTIYFEDGSQEKIMVPWSDEGIPIPSVANDWQQISYNKEKGYILLHVERNLTELDKYLWGKEA